jgi:hypothetical protein
MHCVGVAIMEPALLGICQPFGSCIDRGTWIVCTGQEVVLLKDFTDHYIIDPIELLSGG